MRVTAAVHAGLISGEKTSSQVNIALSEVMRFQREFVISEEIVSRWDITHRAFSEAMRAAGFLPVANILEVNYWKRSEVEMTLSVLNPLQV